MTIVSEQDYIPASLNSRCYIKIVPEVFYNEIVLVNYKWGW